MFSEGWLSVWKKRHQIKQFIQYGELNDAVQHHCVLGLDEMNTVRTILENYNLQDIFNFDKTGYFFRMQPDRRLCTELLEGSKKNKLRITVGFICNGTGSEKLPLWIIGKAKDPRCFKNLNRDNLGAIYRFNQTAWMKHDIMIEYLYWFDRKMTGRKVALLMDNFSAHELAVKPIGNQLQNTWIIWLPANTTSVWQPLDQGIIQSWKAHTRRHYVRYLVKETEKVEVGVKIPEVTLLEAIQWAVEAWNNDVKSSTIFNCFTKSTVKYFGPTQLRSEGGSAARDMIDLVAEVRADMEILYQNRYIQEPIDVGTYLNPIEERVKDTSEDIEVSSYLLTLIECILLLTNMVQVTSSQASCSIIFLSMIVTKWH
jgi:hypothetical protein